MSDDPRWQILEHQVTDLEDRVNNLEGQLRHVADIAEALGKIAQSLDGKLAAKTDEAK